MAENESKGFTFEDACAVIRKLKDSPSIILVGGQALNFWAEQFRSSVAELEQLAPYQSSDIDFLATAADVESCARRLGGKAVYPSPDHINTPEVGIVYCLINGKAVKIDFLGYLAGPRRRDVEQAAIKVQVAEGIVLRVMHPLNVLESRIGNITQLGRKDSLSLRQLQVSIYVVQAYIERAAGQDSRIALDLIESLFEITMSAAGLKIWREQDIDIFSAIQTYAGLPAKFSEVRYPQMKQQLAEKRRKHPKTPRV